MYHQQLHLIQRAHWDMFLKLTPKNLPASWQDENVFMKTPSLVKHFTLLSPTDFLHHNIHEWTIFSFAVHHSRFSTLLSSLTEFLWFTCGLFSGLVIYVMATSLWTLKNFRFPDLYNQTSKYQLEKDIFKNFNSWWFHILPSSVQAYNHSYHGISFILTKLKNRYILKSWKNKMHLLFTQKCIQDFFDRNSIFNNQRLQYD